MLDQISPTIYQRVNGDTSSYLTGSYMNSMADNETDPAEVVRLAESLKNSYSIGSVLSQLPLWNQQLMKFVNL